MKILFLYTPNQSLLSKFYQELLETLAKRGHLVWVYYEKKQTKSYTQQGVHYLGKTKKSLLKRYVRIGKTIKEVKPEVVISNFSYINPALVMGTLFGVKQNIAWFHTAFNHSKRHWFHVWFKKRCFEGANRVITNSYKLADDIERNYGVKQHKVEVLPFWTEIETIQPEEIPEIPKVKEGKMYLGIPARLVKDKNHELVFKALSQLSVPCQWTLFIAGMGPDKEILKEQVIQYGLENKVMFLGQLNQRQLKYFYRAMDLVILPSLNESFGLVFIEAIALGTPVLVSQAFGALDFMDKPSAGLDKWTFQPKAETDFKPKLEAFLKGEGQPPSFYFKDLYLHTYNKNQIINQFEKLLTYS